MSFDPKALHAALDAHRQARHMTWVQVAADLAVSASTIQDMVEKRAVESDGVLQMTRWLGLNIENFVGEGTGGGLGPDPGDWRSTGRFLRLDAKALYAAVDEKRRRDGLSWQQASEAISHPRATAPFLMTLKKGPRVDVYVLLAITQWLRIPSRQFARLTTS